MKAMEIHPLINPSQRAAWLASTSLTYLKPRLQRVFRPTARFLACSGVSANLVTLLGLLGSAIVGGVLLLAANRPVLFALLPIWLGVRMVFNTVDGLLANEFGQRSRIGAVLDEVGDILSDIVLCFPLALVAPIQPHRFIVMMLFGVASELTGMAGRWFGVGRRQEGPFGKTDRAFAFGTLGLWVAIEGTLPRQTVYLMPVLISLHLITIANRVKCISASAKNR